MKIKRLLPITNPIKDIVKTRLNNLPHAGDKDTQSIGEFFHPSNPYNSKTKK